LDEKDSSVYRWILISWSPDSSSVRNKMLYASTKSSLKQEFGGGQIKDDVYGNIRVRNDA
jgi:twinfilin-like protein